MDTEPSLDDLRRFLIRTLPDTSRSGERAVQLVLSPSQARHLAVLLGWLPTPTPGQCHTVDGVFCCPACGATGTDLHQEATGTALVTSQPGEVANLTVKITAESRDRAGRWAIRCQRCHLAFHPPPR